MKFSLTNDYLKYWKVVRQWARSKHQLSTSEIEMILFLYSEGPFKRKAFDEYNDNQHNEVARFIREKMDMI